MQPNKPEATPPNEVKCNECNWKGLRSELKRVDDNEEIDACPACGGEETLFYIIPHSPIVNKIK